MRSKSFLVVLLSCLLVAPAFGAKKPKADAGAPAKDDSSAPKDAQFTLYCQAIGGLDHVGRANMAKNDLVRTSGLKDWYVIHSDAESVIYYGFYRCINDPKDKKETARAQNDLKQITGLADAQGNKIFGQCLFVEITSPDPTAPAEWDLRNADGFWSLEIAVYKDSPQRKQAAVDAVREARKQGVPAYYFHGPTASSVCIGTWPRDAFDDGIAKGAPDDPNGGAIVAPDSEQDLVVLPTPLDPNVQIRNRDGQRVQELTPRTSVRDPSLAAMIAQYPTHAVNGDVMITRAKDPATGQVSEVSDPSLMVRIPPKAFTLLNPGQGQPEQAPPPSLLQPPTSGQPKGTGRLKSIGN